MSGPLISHAFLDAPGGPAGPFLAMAHRGGAHHPDLVGLENTARAFRHAVELGYRYLETDVHLSADGRLLAFHDDVLERVTDRRGQVATVDARILEAARVGGLEPIPYLADLLEEFSECRFNIDLKSAGAVDALADLLDATGAHDRICVGSFSHRRLSRFRRRTGGRVATSASPVEVAAVLTLPSARAVRRLATGSAVALQVPCAYGRLPIVTPEVVRRAHAAGVQVHVWTVDDPVQMGELIDLGVDGLITDRTDLLRDVLLARGLWEDGR